MKNYVHKAFFASIIAAFAAGCTSTMSMPGSVMQSNVPLTQGGYEILNNGQTVSGSATTVSKISALGVRQDPNQSARMQDAIKNALAQCPGADALINITTDVNVKTTTYPIPIVSLFMAGKIEHTTIVTGTPVKIK